MPGLARLEKESDRSEQQEQGGSPFSPSPVAAALEPVPRRRPPERLCSTFSDPLRPLLPPLARSASVPAPAGDAVHSGCRRRPGRRFPFDRRRPAHPGRRPTVQIGCRQRSQLLLSSKVVDRWCFSGLTSRPGRRPPDRQLERRRQHESLAAAGLVPLFTDPLTSSVARTRPVVCRSVEHGQSGSPTAVQINETA